MVFLSTEEGILIIRIKILKITIYEKKFRYTINNNDFHN